MIFIFVALEDGIYETVGKMISDSIVHKGPMPKFFDKCLYDMIVYGPDKVKSMEHITITDHELKDNLEKVIFMIYHFSLNIYIISFYFYSLSHSSQGPNWAVVMWLGNRLT